MLTKTSKTRLLKLAAVIEQLPEFIASKKPTPDIPRLTKPIKRFDLGTFIHCGSAACALGTAALHPWFRLKGLKDSPAGFSDEEEGLFTPTYNGSKYFDAGAKFFDLDDNQTRYLFDPSFYPNSHHESSYVANRIRQFVKNDGYIDDKNIPEWKY